MCMHTSASRGIDLTVAIRRATIWMEKRTAGLYFASIFGMSKAKVGVSSIFTLSLQQQSTGRAIIIGEIVSMDMSLNR